MRSFIIIEVEHGEDTDGVQSMAQNIVSDPDWFGDGSLIITRWSPAIDVPAHTPTPDEVAAILQS